MINTGLLKTKTHIPRVINALILGKKIEVASLCSLLQNTNYHISLAESTEELELISTQRHHFELIVMTDSFSEAPDAKLLSYIKQHLNPCKIICLSKNEDEENERLLRSLGLIFFGSYQSFLVVAEKIINHEPKEPEKMQTELLGISFERATLSSAVTQIINAGKEKKKGLVVTPNVDHVVMLQEDSDMKQIYDNALFRYADGMPIVWLSKIVKDGSLPERVTGADLLIAVCEKAAKADLNIYFLGGNPGIAEQAAAKLKGKFAGLKISGIYCPPFGFENTPKETDWIINDINTRNIDILFIGVGAPKQEKWAAKHSDRLQVGPILCVGAAFDFAAGVIHRAPLWIQRSGCEWIWRLASEPTRMWRRYLIRDSQFIPLAWKEISKSISSAYSSRIRERSTNAINRHSTR